MEILKNVVKPRIKILSIDGGGIKGIIPCMILDRIREEVGLPLTSVFDLFAGTSTGGIIALGLTKSDSDGMHNQYEPKDMLEFYTDNGSKIFSKRLRDNKRSVLEQGLAKFSKTEKLVDEPYPTYNLENLLKSKFKDAKLSDALVDVLVTSFDIQKNQTVYFNSRTANGEGDKMIRDVARATSAAPTFFKPLRASIDEQSLGLVDGGVFANNPSILAYCEGKELLKSRAGDKTLLSKSDELPIQPIDRDLPIFMLSIGTGQCEKSINVSKAENFMTKDWLSPLVENIFMDAVSENTHFTMKHLLPPYESGQQRYCRLDIDDLPAANSDMSNASEENINALQEHAKHWLSKDENKAKIEAIVSILKI